MEKEIYKKTFIVISVAVLLVFLVGLLMWNELPEQIPDSWDLNFEPETYSSKKIVVFSPLVFLMYDSICFWAYMWGIRKSTGFINPTIPFLCILTAIGLIALRIFQYWYVCKYMPAELPAQVEFISSSKYL